MMWRLSAALLLLPVVSAAIDAEDPTIDGGLEADGECDASSEDCALNAVQLRGQKMAAETASEAEAEDESQGGSCGQYKCSHHYHSWQRCQCNAGCESHGNCCHDFHSKCTAKAESDASPSLSHHASTHAGAPGKIYGHPDHSKSYPSHPGFTLMLVEEFNAPIDLDSDPIWTWSDGGLTEGQVRFQKQNIKFSGGKMKIVASNVPASNPQTCSHAEVATIPHKPLSSGEMRTRHNIFRYGRYEVRMKAPDVQPGNSHINGNFISTMFVFRDAKYNHWREIDFEITGDAPGAVTTNVLSADHTDRWKAGIQEDKRVGASNARADFHTYAFEWLPGSITWYIDGKQIRTKRGGGVPIPDKSGKIMMNLWIFGDKYSFGGKHGANNRYPMEAEYDWFRFYKWNGETHYPCAGFSSGCLTKDDRYLSSNNPCDGIPQDGTVYGKAPCHAPCGR